VLSVFAQILFGLSILYSAYFNEKMLACIFLISFQSVKARALMNSPWMQQAGSGVQLRYLKTH
jgi:hypothetical protein